ncbi:hypothetical protein [Pseudoalteromonas sp. McH1-42]|uniref:hypothetical protein n=1 Tax=Pseudoalteromonas sp. McH1-42 TaxID=2917752 RepID=UPI001EF6D74F|nr:hypothetical protein [Pseudoalteromonas sp. McH1-42]MCG7564627.1 hypothetical protein [Pseudoalteromonas sp. McH1-42]
MASFLEQALEAGFSFVDKKKTKIKKVIIPGYSLEIVLVDGTWGELYEVGFNLWSPRFGKTMNELFGEYEKVAVAYHTRDFIDNPEGCLSVAGVGWDEAPSGEMELYAAATYLSFETLISSLLGITNSSGIYSLIYEGDEASFFPPSELLWVYLYLHKEMGFSSDEILDKLAGEKKNFPAKTLKPIDLELLNAFDGAYEKARKKENRK